MFVLNKILLMSYSQWSYRFVMVFGIIFKTLWREQLFKERRKASAVCKSVFNIVI